MKINRVELTNVKCYEQAEFNFENGINFISGRNGAGKTTIIESIGYALFDYKITRNFTSYFIRRGEKKASVRIYFQDKNDVEFIVDRKIGIQAVYNNWVIKDKENEMEIASGEDNVKAWLKEHLDFYASDNISQIYENIIGVPQGMFTAIFLDTDKNRRDKLDPIFNLEMYRKVYTNTTKLESGMKEKNNQYINELNSKNGMISILSESTKEYETIIKEKQKHEKEKNKREKELVRINKNLDKIRKIKEDLEKDVKELEDLEKNISYEKELEKQEEILTENLKKQIKDKLENKKSEGNRIKTITKELEKLGNSSDILKQKQEIESKKNKIEWEIETIEKRYKELADGICPYIGKECIHVENSKKEDNEKIDKYNTQLKELVKKQKEIEERYEKITDNEKELLVHETNVKNLEKTIIESKENEKQSKLRKEKIKKNLENLISKQEKLKIKLDEKREKSKEKYNEEEQKNLEKAQKELIQKITELSILVKTKQDEIIKIEKQISQLNELKEETNKIKTDIEKLEKAIIVLNKIRQLIKEAPESISKVLIQSVGKRAANIYHQISTDDTRLQWKENYELVLIDSIDGKIVEKDFRQLSRRRANDSGFSNSHFYA